MQLEGEDNSGIGKHLKGNAMAENGAANLNHDFVSLNVSISFMVVGE
ncbi:hypothetical protein N836_19865 [Leptolyngbya sp. Heron Island J]|nr:hypothetical protein N836_19865 [Leptolyngbya sp. Heron Island J]